MPIIGLCGRKGSGKSTLCSQIPGAIQLPLAKPLKDALEAMGVPREYLYNPELKEVPVRLLQGKTARFAMITLGTEWGRDMIGPDIWVDFWLEAANKLPDDALIVVDDVRFPQEIEMLQDIGAFLVAIRKPTHPPKNLLERVVRWWKERRAHPSERLKFSDYNIPEIWNIGTPQELYREFMSAYEQHRGT